MLCFKKKNIKIDAIHVLSVRILYLKVADLHSTQNGILTVLRVHKLIFGMSNHNIYMTIHVHIFTLPRQFV